jgi:hypothetical protein
MIIENSRYKDYDKITLLAQTARKEFNNDSNEWKQYIDQMIDLKDQEHRDDIDWRVLHIFNEAGSSETIPSFVHEKFKHTIEVLKSMEGVDRALINFVGPNSIIPHHVDSDELPEYAETGIYNIVVGLFIPSEDPEQVALEIDGVVVGNKNDGAVIFDGQVPHSGYNKTNEWRVTLFLFVNKKAFK